MRNEASAKKTFRDALHNWSSDLMTWTNTDAFRHGLPDFFIAYSGITMAVEAKFVTDIPKRGTSLVLNHEVSQSQIQFMKNFQKSGNKGVILIGLEDVFVYTTDFKKNYTKDELLVMPRIQKHETQSDWDLTGFIFDFLKKGNT